MSRKPFSNPFANPDHPLDYRDGKPVYARDARELIIPPRPEPNPRPHPNPATGVVSWNNLQWENPAYRESGQTEKKLFTYDESLARLQQAGYQRHAHPAEAMQFLAAGLEGKLTGEKKAIFDDMLTSYGEWMSVAMERKGDVLVAYLDPVGLQWNKSANKYDISGSFTYSDRREFPVAGKKSNNWVDLNQFPDDFVQYFYGQSFSALPKEMREGNKKAQIFLPIEGNIWPVGRGYFDYSRFYIGIHVYSRASRGVRSAPKVP